MKHKLFSLLLALLINMATSVASAYNAEIDGIYYNFSGSNATVTYKTTSYNSYSGDIVIPEAVTYNETTYSVTSIGSSAFRKCTNLTSITIPSSVTAIGEGAFFLCSSLTSITIPESVTEIVGGAFHNTAWYDNLPDGLVYVGKVVYSYKGTMPNNTEIVLENGIVGIAGGAFGGCTNLTSITIPESVTSIGNYAFKNCTGLTSIIIPDNVTTIGEFVFEGCTCLTTAIIGNSVTSIGDGMFYDCSALSYVKIGNSVILINNYAFYGCTSLPFITIPNSVTSIGKYVFDGCNNLKYIISLSESAPSIYEFLFSEISAKIIVLMGCKSNYRSWGIVSEGFIMDDVCYEQISTNSIQLVCDLDYREERFVVPAQVTYHGITYDITSIGSGAFLNCRLRNLSVRRETPPKASTDSFSEQTYYHTMLYIPMGTWDAYAYDAAWYKFINIRETAMESNNVAPENAYTLMNAKDFTYAVYDPVNDCVGMVSSVGVNEDNPNHCWQTVEVSGKKFLYNIGAKKFAVPATDGSSFTLSETVGSVEMTDGADGIVLNGHTETQWALVLNESMNTDNTVEDVIVTAIERITDNGNAHDSPIYDLNGREITKPTKGIYIVNGKRVLIR